MLYNFSFHICGLDFFARGCVTHDHELRVKKENEERRRSMKEKKYDMHTIYSYYAYPAAICNLRSRKVYPASGRPDLVPRIILSQRSACTCARLYKIESASQEQSWSVLREEEGSELPDVFLSLCDFYNGTESAATRVSGKNWYIGQTRKTRVLLDLLFFYLKW